MDKKSDVFKMNVEEQNKINQEEIISLLKSIELQICRLENRILNLEYKLNYVKPKNPFMPVNPFGPNPPGTLL